MICREARRLLDPFIDNELDPVDSADLRVHLASCDACRRLLADSESLGRLVRLLPYYPASEQLREILRLSTRPRFNPGVLIGAAVLALAVSFWAISDLNDAELGALMRAFATVRLNGDGSRRPKSHRVMPTRVTRCRNR